MPVAPGCDVLVILARMRPDTTDVEAWRNAYLQRSLAERQAVAAAARRTSAALRADPWVRQHARVIDQTARLLAFDYTRPETEAPKAMLHRDRAMTRYTAWLHRPTGAKLLVSAQRTPELRQRGAAAASGADGMT